MKHLHGKFVWFEHVSNDISRARTFYDALFDWHTEDTAGGGEPYHMIVNHRRGPDGIGGYRNEPEGQRPYWLAYMSVDDVDETYQAALAAAAQPLQPPAEYAVGRGAVLADPSGAVFALWNDAHGDRPDAARTPAGGWHWNELWTGDEIGALAFYQRVFGYGHESMDMGRQGTYYILKKNGVSRAGIARSIDSAAPSMWLPYVAVDHCDDTAARCAALGGQVLSAPRNVPGIGRFAVLADPVGAAIAVIRPHATQSAATEAAMSVATAA